MRYAVLDTETTGFEEHDQIVEIGMVVLGEKRDVRWSSLVRPSCPVHPAARGTHHILDKELARAPTLAELLLQKPLSALSDFVLVGHYLEFDMRMLRQSGVPDAMLPSLYICTLQCARHVWPKAPGYRNQTLRYWLELDVPALDLPPHRALPDAIVTAALLRALLRLRSGEELLRLTKAPVLLERVPMGKYRGKPWSDVEESYCAWILNVSQPPFNADVRHTAQHWLDKKREKRKELAKHAKDSKHQQSGVSTARLRGGTK